MIIEFFGPSGAGKTTIARELNLNTGWEYIVVNSRKEKFKYNVIFLFHSFIKFFSLFIKTISEGGGSFSLTRHKLHLLSEYIARNEKARIVGRKHNVILDEGLVQYGLSLYEKNISKLDAKKYIDRFATVQNKIQVVILCNDSERIKRMEKRKRIPRAFLNLDKEEWQKTISNNTNIFTDIFMKQDAFVFDSLKDDIKKIVDTIIHKT